MKLHGKDITKGSNPKCIYKSNRIKNFLNYILVLV